MADEDWNPYFRAIYEHCAAKPLAVEDHPWGETVFKVGGKVFAFIGQHDRGGVTVKVTPDQIDSLLSLPFVRRSAYIGRYGWLSLSVADDDALELALELIDESYALISAKSRRRTTAKPPKGGAAGTARKKKPR
jgi:predicted DNA-binding protein (MmcQ/YjbR family)